MQIQVQVQLFIEKFISNIRVERKYDVKDLDYGMVVCARQTGLSIISQVI